MIYLDQAASSFPKPASVAQAMADAVNTYGANPGRSGHQLSRQASFIIEETRSELKDMFQAPSVERIIFTSNATTALNQAIAGLSWEKGDHVITTVLEHNSVRRPLERLRTEIGINVDYIGLEGNWTEEISKKITKQTKLVVVTHGSNVTGQILPIQEIGQLVSEYDALFCVDGSQTAGILPISMKEMRIDMLAVPGHKALLGPQGVGVLLVGTKVELKPLYVGGTGSQSEKPEQPCLWPIGWESGTMNTPGIAGLLKGILEVQSKGITDIHEHEKQLTSKLIQGLKKIDSITVYGPEEGEDRLGVVSFQLDSIDSHEIAIILDNHYQIAVRAGLHCSPMIHQKYQTTTGGLVRVSVGIYNTENEIIKFLEAMKEIKEGLLG
ncbi:aminotransferase class V-fold PLP-dependent enzyme [Salipaludibacillus sp. CF4.18]|uniref:aminotransferase class V-fold PLP-dependent enzyme n=1 Tax=Salipaludibacillus sp. CF4.18 TaxID=3373081 RepID=UPI003EE5D6A9